MRQKGLFVHFSPAVEQANKLAVWEENVGIDSRPGGHLEYCGICGRSFVISLWKCHEHNPLRRGCGNVLDWS